MKLDTVDLVIKLGGSAITHKESELLPNTGVLESIAGELADLRLSYSRSDRCFPKIILVYGGGSFGHFEARKYLRYGIVSSPNGFSQVKAAMLTLSKIITDTFLNHDLPIFCIHPSSCFVMTGEQPGEGDYFIEPVKRALEYGLLPALGGDIVLDRSGTARILSGDTIARLLATNLGAKALAFGSDVDGILTPEGKVIKNICADELSALTHGIKGRSGDVTGGMAGKVKEISSYLSEGGKLSIVFNITKPGLLTKVLKGEHTEGTYIAASPAYLP